MQIEHKNAKIGFLLISTLAHGKMSKIKSLDFFTIDFSFSLLIRHQMIFIWY